ncbi:hypothetical protein PVK06_000289 [Gossypium arboreum]|uniref:Knottins-like domain-containing protein n=1 Tax=Gossypium arboreum TaxID=29729 RepID=A0ABR0QY59_GOSAR|nr:hypothetical protein PVK06_000289 [Gossypium arboreum]
MGPVAVEGGPICKATSNVYKGLCLIDDSCDIVCKREGFHKGNCKGFLRKCDYMLSKCTCSWARLVRRLV